MITSAIVFVGITAIGGLWSSGLSNILSVTVIYLGIIYSLIRILIRDGGISGINAALPAADFNWFSPMGGLSFAVLMGWIIVMTTQAITPKGRYRLPAAPKAPRKPEKDSFSRPADFPHRLLIGHLRPGCQGPVPRYQSDPGPASDYHESRSLLFRNDLSRPLGRRRIDGLHHPPRSRHAHLSGRI